jgi:hypothetical protein
MRAVEERLAEALEACQELSMALAGLGMDVARAERQLKASRLANGHLREAIMSVRREHAAAVKLLDYALHLRMHRENAPGGTETWAQFDRDVEAFLRAQPVEAWNETPKGTNDLGNPGDSALCASGGCLHVRQEDCYSPVRVPENTGKHPEESAETGTNPVIDKATGHLIPEILITDRHLCRCGVPDSCICP